MITRRNLLKFCIASCLAPPFVRASSLMGLSVRQPNLIDIDDFVFWGEDDLDHIRLADERTRALAFSLLETKAMVTANIMNIHYAFFPDDAPLILARHPLVRT